MSVTIPSIDTPQSSSSPTELWAIIEKQRDIIQELQKALIDMTAERDDLLNKIKDLTPISSSSSSFTEESTANNSVSSNSTATKIPIPPPRSPFRSNNITNESSDTQKTIPPPLPPPLPPIKKKFSANERHSSYAAKLQNKDLVMVNDPVTDTIEYEGAATTIEFKVSSMLSSSFILSVVNRKTRQEMWQIEKTFSDLLVLDMTLKSNLTSFTINSNTRSPALIEEYLADVIHYLNYDKIAICIYSFIVQKQIKAGYLTKRGKYDTGSKKYYFIMNDESELKYFCTNEDDQLLMWNIPLVAETRIGKQSKKSRDSTLFYHAFIILFDPTTCKNTCQPYKYILCAESDAERDDWVKILLLHSQQQNQKKDSKLSLPKHNSRYVRSNSDTSITLPPQDLLNESSADIMPANRPIRHKVYQRSSMDDKAILRYYQSIENKKGSSQHLLSNKASADSLPNIVDLQELNQQLKAKKEKVTTYNSNHKSFWSPKNFFSNAGANQHNTISFPFNASVHNRATENITSFFNITAPKYPVFGVPLEEATHATKISENFELPSILYRCIEFLEAKDAVHEEGIYRLSGSSALVSFLKQQFCEYGDVDILSLAQQDSYLDVHVVAGLLKMWLRELPVNVLTNDLIPDFLSAINEREKKSRVRKLGLLVSMLPIANYSLLRTLIAHLIHIVHNAEHNKMTLRNISIIFAPTLSMPSGVFTLLMSEFEYIFYTKPSYSQSNKSSSKTMITSSSVDIPRPEPSSSAERFKQQYLKAEESRSSRNSVTYKKNIPLSIMSLEAMINEDTCHHMDLILEQVDIERGNLIDAYEEDFYPKY